MKSNTSKADFANKVNAVKETAPLQETRKKSKAGRPKAQIPKNKKVLLSFTEDEHNQLLELANSSGRSLTNLLRLEALDLINN